MSAESKELVESVRHAEALADAVEHMLPKDRRKYRDARETLHAYRAWTTARARAYHKPKDRA